MTEMSDFRSQSHAGITFTYLRFGRAYGTCSCGWQSQDVRFGRYNKIVNEWDEHKADIRRCCLKLTPDECAWVPVRQCTGLTDG